MLIQVMICTVQPVVSQRIRRLSLFLVFCLLSVSHLLAQTGAPLGSGAVHEIRTLYPSEWGVPYPTGLAYKGDLGHLFLLDKSSAEPSRTTSTVVTITPYEDLVTTIEIDFTVDDAINMAFDDGSQRLFLLNDQRAEVAQVQVGADGNLNPATLVRFDLAALALQDAQGLAVDVAQRRLFILDSGALQVVSVALDETGVNSAAVAHMDLAHLGVGGLRGLAIHPVTHQLYLVSQATQQLYALTAANQLVAHYELAELTLIDSGGLLFAPSADMTDPPETLHLFIADSALKSNLLERASMVAAEKVYLPLTVETAGQQLATPSVLVATQGAAQQYGEIVEAVLECEGCDIQSVTIPITQSHNDAEESPLIGQVITDSMALELIQAATITQTVGLRFPAIPIPTGARIVRAAIEFTANEPTDTPTTLLFHGEATDDAAPFAATDANISGRTLTTAGVSWPDVPAWSVAQEKHQTPDLSPIVQEIVDRSGWRSGNALAFMISGTGKRTAEAYDGNPVYAPRLIVDYIAPAAVRALRFAVIGDYGNNDVNEARVAALVNSWNPDFVITTGDNNYPDGEAATIDDNIGQYYSQFIGNYRGAYGPGSPTNRFWPILGNHDWHTITCVGDSCTGAYFDYFTLPNNERYYDLDFGLVHLFALDSGNSEPDGRNQNSVQAAWLRDQLAASTACHNFVYFHHAAYASGHHGPIEIMQWPFTAWGADAVFSGHEHLYERLDVHGTPYFVNGAGGAKLYAFSNVGNLPPVATSLVRYNEDHGAMLVTATATGVTYQFYNADGLLIDDYIVPKDCAAVSAASRAGATATAAVADTVADTVTPTGVGAHSATQIDLPIGALADLSLRTIHVPNDVATIQAAIDLADDGDVVLVAPGEYHENLVLAGKTITLASHLYTTGDPSFIDRTIIDGGGETVMAVRPSMGPETQIVGFTIQNGDDGIKAAAKLHILHNRFVGNRDAVDYQKGGGFCRNNTFDANRDDAIDLDGATAATIENNLIRNSGDDGIEIRLHPYEGPALNIIIRGNIITDSDEDGIQLVDYAGVSDRIFRIERNVIKNSAMAGMGLMDNEETKEDFRGASLVERIYLFNNTFVNNDYGLVGGGNLIALNNIFIGSYTLALKNVDGNSIAAYNLFWRNGANHQNSNVDTTHTVVADPLLDVTKRLLSGSPALDAGIAFFQWNEEVVLELQPDDYAGAAPDLGAFEHSCCVR